MYKPMKAIFPLNDGTSLVVNRNLLITNDAVDSLATYGRYNPDPGYGNLCFHQQIGGVTFAKTEFLLLPDMEPLHFDIQRHEHDKISLSIHFEQRMSIDLGVFSDSEEIRLLNFLRSMRGVVIRYESNSDVKHYEQH